MVLVFLALIGSLVHAAETCPTLSGVYDCPKQGEFDAFVLTLTQEDKTDPKTQKPYTEYKYVYSIIMEYSLTQASVEGMWNQDQDIRYFAKCVGDELHYSDKDLNSDVKRRYIQKTFIDQNTGALTVLVNDQPVQTCSVKSRPGEQK